MGEQGPLVGTMLDVHEAFGVLQIELGTLGESASMELMKGQCGVLSFFKVLVRVEVML